MNDLINSMTPANVTSDANNTIDNEVNTLSYSLMNVNINKYYCAQNNYNKTNIKNVKLRQIKSSHELWYLFDELANDNSSYLKKKDKILDAFELKTLYGLEEINGLHTILLPCFCIHNHSYSKEIIMIWTHSRARNNGFAKKLINCLIINLKIEYTFNPLPDSYDFWTKCGITKFIHAGNEHDDILVCMEEKQFLTEKKAHNYDISVMTANIKTNYYAQNNYNKTNDIKLCSIKQSYEFWYLFNELANDNSELLKERNYILDAYISKKLYGLEEIGKIDGMIENDLLPCFCIIHSNEITMIWSHSRTKKNSFDTKLIQLLIKESMVYNSNFTELTTSHQPTSYYNKIKQFISNLYK